MSIPTTTDDVQCRAGTTFACLSPVVDCTDHSHYLITKLTYTLCRGVVFCMLGKVEIPHFFSSNIYAWNNFSDSTSIIF